ncbi:MAG: hypothetical protein II229_05400 [Clostridia bacterium]|nr:hypothetical protein [Clostridia bacterium]
MPITSAKIAKLADFYIVYDHLFGDRGDSGHSAAPPPAKEVLVETAIIETNGESEFLRAVDGRPPEKVWDILNDLVEAIKSLHPRMYAHLIDKLKSL